MSVELKLDICQEDNKKLRKRIEELENKLHLTDAGRVFAVEMRVKELEAELAEANKKASQRGARMGPLESEWIDAGDTYHDYEMGK